MRRVLLLSMLCLLLTTVSLRAQLPVQPVPIGEILDRPVAPDPPQKVVPEILPAPVAPPVTAPAPAPAVQGINWDAPCAPATFDNPVGNPGVFTTNLEYLLWFIKGENLPSPLVSTDSSISPVPLTTTSPPTATDMGQTFKTEPLSGVRVSVGYWFTTDVDRVTASNPLYRDTGVEITGFVLGQRSITLQADSSPTLLRPFYDLNDNKESSFLVAAPGVATGGVSATDKVNLWGAEANFWQTVYANPPGQTIRIDALGGFRFLDFDSTLGISSRTVYDAVQTNPALASFAGNKIDVTDAFRTTNQFYGGQVGFQFNYIIPCLIASASFKLGLGDTHQTITVSGSQVRTTPGGVSTVSEGGLYAQSSNMGTFDRDRLSLVPEFDINLALPIGRRFMIYGGYTLLGWNQVVRSGSQVDSVIDITQIPNFPAGAATSTGLGRPAVPFKEDFLFVHGLNVGLKVIW